MARHHQRPSRRESSAPPAAAISYASWAFLFKNFRHALWLGWPYLIFSIVINGVPLFLFNYLTFRSHTAPDAFFDDFTWLAPTTFTLNILIFILEFTLAPVLLCCLAVGWMRAITRGVSYKNHCSFRDEWKLVFCCIAQMLGIYLWCYILGFVLFITGFGLLYLFSSILPQALLESLVTTFSTIPSLLTAILIVTLAPLFFLAPSFLYFPAKANGIVISSNLGRKLFRGLALQFVGTTALALLPFGLVIFAYFIGLEFIHGPIELMGFYTFNVILVFAVTTINFLFALIFCGVLSGYYLWVRENRMPKRRQATVPDDPFSDEGWDGPMWEDFR